jgi:hypothetical protein
MQRWTTPVWLLTTFLMGCIDTFDPPQEADCEQPVAYYPDEDGDGFGEPGSIYVGCAPPEGWVSTLMEPQDTGAPPDTGQDSGLDLGI